MRPESEKVALKFPFSVEHSVTEVFYFKILFFYLGFGRCET